MSWVALALNSALRALLASAGRGRRVLRASLTVCLWLASSAVLAQSGLAAERQRLADESVEVETRFRTQEAACQQRFAVTDCVNLAKQARRDALAPLRRQSAALDDAQRKQRAAERRAAIGDRLEGAQAREREIVVRETPAAASSAPSAAPKPSAAAGQTGDNAEAAAAPPRSIREARPAKRPPGPRSARAAPAPVNDTQRRTREADAQARSAARVQAAQEHRAEVARRNAERASRGKRADPLPPQPP